jgi:hypothetical protein
MEKAHFYFLVGLVKLIVPEISIKGIINND